MSAPDPADDQPGGDHQEADQEARVADAAGNDDAWVFHVVIVAHALIRCTELAESNCREPNS